MQYVSALTTADGRTESDDATPAISGAWERAFGYVDVKEFSALDTTRHDNQESRSEVRRGEDIQ